MLSTFIPYCGSHDPALSESKMLTVYTRLCCNCHQELVFLLLRLSSKVAGEVSNVSMDQERARVARVWTTKLSYWFAIVFCSIHAGSDLSRTWTSKLSVHSGVVQFEIDKNKFPATWFLEYHRVTVRLCDALKPKHPWNRGFWQRTFQGVRFQNLDNRSHSLRRIDNQMVQGKRLAAWRRQWAQQTHGVQPRFMRLFTCCVYCFVRSCCSGFFRVLTSFIGMCWRNCCNGGRNKAEIK